MSEPNDDHNAMPEQLEAVAFNKRDIQAIADGMRDEARDALWAVERETHRLHQVLARIEQFACRIGLLSSETGDKSGGG